MSNSAPFQQSLQRQQTLLQSYAQQQHLLAELQSEVQQGMLSASDPIVQNAQQQLLQIQGAIEQEEALQQQLLTTYNAQQQSVSSQPQPPVLYTPYPVNPVVYPSPFPPPPLGVLYQPPPLAAAEVVAPLLLAGGLVGGAFRRPVYRVFPGRYRRRR